MAHGHAADAAHGHGQGGHSGPHHGAMYYVKIWVVLLVLMILSLIGAEIGIRWLTLFSAFGIAVIKALIVCAYFMHLNIEKRYIWYLMYTMLLLVGLFFIGVRSDINRMDGHNWTAPSKYEDIERHKKEKEHAPAPHH